MVTLYAREIFLSLGLRQSPEKGTEDVASGPLWPRLGFTSPLGLDSRSLLGHAGILRFQRQRVADRKTSTRIPTKFTGNHPRA